MASIGLSRLGDVWIGGQGFQMDRFKEYGRELYDVEQEQEVRLCLICDRQLKDDESTEFLKCDDCGAAGCQHSIKEYDDYRYATQRLYCVDCGRDVANA